MGDLEMDLRRQFLNASMFNVHTEFGVSVVGELMGLGEEVSGELLGVWLGMVV